MEVSVIAAQDVTHLTRISEELCDIKDALEAVQLVLADVLTPLLDGLAPLNWARTTIAIDGLLSDHKNIVNSLSPRELLTSLLVKESNDDHFVAKNIEYFTLCLLRCRLRLNPEVHDEFRMKIQSVLESFGLELTEPVARLLTVELLGANYLRTLPRPEAMPESFSRLSSFAGVTHLAPGIFFLPLFTGQECQTIVQHLAESDAWKSAAIVDYKDILGEERDPHKFRRKASTLSAEISLQYVENFRARVLEKVAPVLNQVWQFSFDDFGGHHFVRYGSGDYFDAHTDQGVKTRARQFSVVCYLNSNFEGGRTSFPVFNYYVQPQVGYAVVFPSEYLHSSTPITEGSKFIAVGFVSGKVVNQDYAPLVA
jgi:hypothetical protein